MTPLITIEHVKSICKPGTHECCAYLVLGGEGFECAKLLPGIKMQIEKRLVAGTIRAAGDNCSGPPEFTLST